jgi:crotonobetainyl-CoA:carnitine CoA-transferase CaiB-like acyl-CoA transferase
MPGPLSHIKVLDLSRVLAAPWTGQNLADLGAEVIKVERPQKGDDSRAFGPPWLKDADGNDTTESAYFLAANRGKRSIAIDLSKPAGQDVVRRLATRCDVLLENYKFGDLARYGLGYDDLKAIHPPLIYCSVTGFGHTGPYRERPGYDFMIQGMGGLMSITGERDALPGGGPQRVGVPIVDIMTGMYASIAVCAALAHREKERHRPASRPGLARYPGRIPRQSGDELPRERRSSGKAWQLASQYRAVPDVQHV